MSSADKGGYFCVLCVSLPMLYPEAKHVRPKLNTAISPKISISISPPFPDSFSGFYVLGGSQTLLRGLTACHPGGPRKILLYIAKKHNSRMLFSLCGGRTPMLGQNKKAHGVSFNAPAPFRCFSFWPSVHRPRYLCTIPLSAAFICPLTASIYRSSPFPLQLLQRMSLF